MKLILKNLNMMKFNKNNSFKEFDFEGYKHFIESEINKFSESK